MSEAKSGLARIKDASSNPFPTTAILFLACDFYSDTDVEFFKEVLSLKLSFIIVYRS